MQLHQRNFIRSHVGYEVSDVVQIPRLMFGSDLNARNLPVLYMTRWGTSTHGLLPRWDVDKQPIIPGIDISIGVSLLNL
jgi:hypothetical protein